MMKATDFSVASVSAVVGSFLWRFGFGRLGHAEHDLKEQQPAFDVTRNEEVLFHMLFAVAAEFRREFRMSEQVADLVGAALDRVHQHAGKFVNDLRRNAADGA